jgi:hypothetical protein
VCGGEWLWGSSVGFGPGGFRFRAGEIARPNNARPAYVFVLRVTGQVVSESELVRVNVEPSKTALDFVSHCSILLWKICTSQDFFGDWESKLWHCTCRCRQRWRRFPPWRHMSWNSICVHEVGLGIVVEIHISDSRAGDGDDYVANFLEGRRLGGSVRPLACACLIIGLVDVWA